MSGPARQARQFWRKHPWLTGDDGVAETQRRQQAAQQSGGTAAAPNVPYGNAPASGIPGQGLVDYTRNWLYVNGQLGGAGDGTDGFGGMYGGRGLGGFGSGIVGADALRGAGSAAVTASRTSWLRSRTPPQRRAAASGLSATRPPGSRTRRGAADGAHQADSGPGRGPRARWRRRSSSRPTRPLLARPWRSATASAVLVLLARSRASASSRRA